MRNVGFSIFDIFQPISLVIFLYGIFILFFLNPLSAISEIEYNRHLDNQNVNMYSINFSENNLWIKNKNYDDGVFFINIKNFNIKEMIAKNIEILSINKNKKEFYQSKYGEIIDKNFILSDVNRFDITNDKYFYDKKFVLNLNFSKENILTSNINYKNIPYYNYIDHVKAHTQKEKIRNKYSGKLEDADERFMRSIEESIGIVGSATDGFRSDVTAYMFAKMRHGETVDYTSYEPLKEAIEAYLINSVKDMARIVTKSKTRDDQQKKKHGEMVQTLIEEYGYNSDSAEEILTYASNNLWRDS